MTSVLQQQQSRSDGGTYTFASQPRALTQRKKYRELPNVSDTPSHPVYGNIMYDRRVVRGSTYAQRTLPASAQPDPIELQRQQEVRRRENAKRRAKQQLRVRSPEPVDGRKHTDVQTELYLEELSDRIEEADVECQTDAFLDRPPSPMFVPAKSGVDCETQILEGELFDFNIEVKPVLEVLVGKTLEQALVEVMEEEELANLREQQRIFQELRNAELVEQQRLEEEDRRRRLEKEQRMQQQIEAMRIEKETSEKIAARSFAQSYLADLVPSVFGLLSENGYFYDPVERAVENEFLPWLMESVDEQLRKSETSRQMLDAIIREVVRSRSEQFAQLEADETRVAEDEVADAVDERSTSAVAAPIGAEDDTNKEAGENPDADASIDASTDKQPDTAAAIDAAGDESGEREESGDEGDADE